LKHHAAVCSSNCSQGPFHDDNRATARKHAGDAVDHITWIGDVMEGGRGDDCVDLWERFGALDSSRW
jgi:hypothetical protein